MTGAVKIPEFSRLENLSGLKRSESDNFGSDPVSRRSNSLHLFDSIFQGFVAKTIYSKLKLDRIN